MNDHNHLAIQTPIAISQQHQAACDRLAGLFDCLKRELSGALDGFISIKNSQDHVAMGQVCSWCVTGFLGDQLAGEESESPMARLFANGANAGVQRISIAPARVSGAHHRCGSYARELNRLWAGLKTMMPLAENHGVDLCLRPGEGGFLTSPVELREFIETINSPALGVDLSTQMAAGLADWLDWFAILEPSVRSVGVEIDLNAGDTANLSQVQNVLEAIESVCVPRTYAGAITIYPATS